MKNLILIALFSFSSLSIATANSIEGSKAECEASRSIMNTWAFDGADKDPIPFPTVLPGMRAKSAAKKCAIKKVELELAEKCSSNNEILLEKDIEASCVRNHLSDDRIVSFKCYALGKGVCSEN